jgi:hypothetical protein
MKTLRVLLKTLNKLRYGVGTTSRMFFAVHCSVSHINEVSLVLPHRVEVVKKLPTLIRKVTSTERPYTTPLNATLYSRYSSTVRRLLNESLLTNVTLGQIRCHKGKSSLPVELPW